MPAGITFLGWNPKYLFYPKCFALSSPRLEQISSEGAGLSTVLSLFFSISLEEIGEDLARVSEDALLLRSLEKKFRRRRGGEIQPADLARSFHRRFLLGSQMVEFSKLPKEVILFAVSLPAYEIAEMACGLSCDRGELKDLAEILSHCENSGNFAGYDSAVLKSDEILERVHDTIFLDSLGRYGLTSVIELYENDRPAFELQIEVGRRLVAVDLVDLDEHKKFEADFRKKFGPEFLQEFTRRLESHGLAFD